MAAGPGLHEQQAQAPHVGVARHQKNTAGPAAVEGRDPALPSRPGGGAGKLRDDAGDQALEVGVPLVLDTVELAVALDDPAQVAGLGDAERDPRRSFARRRRRLVEQRLDRVQGG